MHNLIRVNLRMTSGIFFAFTALTMGGCGGESGSSTLDGRIDVSKISTAVTPNVCPEGFPNAICGTITVPLDYRVPNAEKIRVAFIQFKAKDTKADGKAAIHLVNGGPGSSWIVEEGQVASQLAGFELFRGAAPDRDLLLIEPRGVGLIDPLPSCPVRLVTSGLGPTREQIEACARAVGPKASNYTAANTAHDFALVTRSLGYTQVDLVGFSYGTFLSSIYASLHSERIRTLTLDGAFPIKDMEFMSEAPYQGTRRMINDSCSRSGTCNADDVWFELAKLVEGLRKSPRIIQLPNGNGTETLTLDATTLAALMTTPPVIAANEKGMPTVYATLIDSILQASRGNWSNFEKALTQQEPTRSPNPEGIINSLTCNDFPLPWSRSDSIETKQLKQMAAETAVPAGKYFPFTAAEWQRRPSNYATSCLFWQASRPNAAEDPANLVLSWPDTLPILVINGDWDAQTHYEAAKSSAAQFKKSTFIRARNDGHLVSPSNTCVRGKVFEFIATRGVEKPEDCLDSEPKEVTIGQPPQAPVASDAKLKQAAARKP